MYKLFEDIRKRVHQMAAQKGVGIADREKVIGDEFNIGNALEWISLVALADDLEF